MSNRGKKANKSGLGKAIIKDKSRRRRGAGKGQADSWLHSSELNDGYDWGRLNLRSVTEESKLDEFLNTAKLAGTEFTAEKLNIKVVDPSDYTGLPSVSEYAEIEQAQKENAHFLSIPRRPKWDPTTTAEQLDQMERDSFLEWRRGLARLEENEKLVLTPFERNLEFWRQLWRVIERSDVVVQIVDARNPLLFRSEDLEKYVKEVDAHKVNVMLISKSDLLTSQQRQAWYKYFLENSLTLTVVFWSATGEIERLKQVELSNSSGPDSMLESESDQDSSSESPTLAHADTTTECTVDADTMATDADATVTDADTKATDSMDAAPIENETIPIPSKDPGVRVSLPEMDEETSEDAAAECSHPGTTSGVVEGDRNHSYSRVDADECVRTSDKADEEWRLLTGEELVDVLLSVSPVKDGGLTTVGMVGYPNVGKSSTINAIIQSKKVPVSATPGRTKHFQTLYVSESLLLCDCPGLVFPTFVSTKAEMVCSGILPIDQMRDHVPPISLVCTRIPRPVLEMTYGIRLPRPQEGEDPDRCPYAEELCGAYGYVRGYMTTHGQPDGPRSARYILKDYVNGRLLYCHPPPGIAPALFNQFPLLGDQDSTENPDSNLEELPQEESPPAKPDTVTIARSEFDKEFFRQAQVRAIKKGVAGPGRMLDATEGKHWKKHNNRNKKEKTRRTQSAVVY